jgi:hypothetical protein
MERKTAGFAAQPVRKNRNRRYSFLDKMAT